MKNIKLWPAFILLGLVISMSTSCDVDTPDYVPPVLDFDLTLPANWIYYNDGLNEPLVFYAISPADKTGDILEDMWVAKYYIESSNLDVFYYAKKVDISTNAVDYEFIYENQDTVINGNPCRKLVHRQKVVIETNYEDIDTMIISNKYFFMNGSDGYLVSFNALDSTYSTFKPIFDTIIHSFNFVEE
jgi:hypothetical protein